jgi:hypothetical protein
MAIPALTRLFELVHRTRLPLIVQSSDASEPCVVLPLSVYEKLVGGAPEILIGDESQPLPVADPQVSLADFMTPVSNRSFTMSSGTLDHSELESGNSLRLQDLLQVQAEIPVKSTVSAVLPQMGSVEDRFAFDGLDVRILPKTRQKIGDMQDALDGSG